MRGIQVGEQLAFLHLGHGFNADALLVEGSDVIDQLLLVGGELARSSDRVHLGKRALELGLDFGLGRRLAMGEGLCAEEEGKCQEGGATGAEKRGFLNEGFHGVVV